MSEQLIAYFTWSGHSEQLARQIQRETGGELFHIESFGTVSAILCDDYDKSGQRKAPEPPTGIGAVFGQHRSVRYGLSGLSQLVERYTDGGPHFFEAI